MPEILSKKLNLKEILHKITVSMLLVGQFLCHSFFKKQHAKSKKQPHSKAKQQRKI